MEMDPWTSERVPDHMLNRKKRRGMIEKRRRDRINNSLNELRRLVPAAFEKQGSAKLEKAEILQMTVDHLKGLHAKGFDTFSFDPHKFAMDYHTLGFRECASEVARYMVAIEGMDLQDPLRVRLMSHLQSYSTQRELSLKSASAHSVWNPSAFTTPPQFATYLSSQHAHSGPNGVTMVSSESTVSIPVSSHYSSGGVSSSSSHIGSSGLSSDTAGSILGSSNLSQSSSMMPPPPPPPPLLQKSTNPSTPPPHSTSTFTYPSTLGAQVIPNHHHPHHHHHHPHHPHSHPHSSQYCHPGHPSAMQAPGQHQSSSQSVKYCRPWYGELAY